MNVSDFMTVLNRTGFSRETLEEHDGPIAGLWPDLRMAYFNPAWFAFARANDGEPAITRDWPPGRSIMEAVPEDLKVFYHWHLEACLKTGIVWSHIYECSSADTYRLFHLRVYPLVNGAGLLAVHSRREEHAHEAVDRPPMKFSPSDHIDRNGFVHQCANCRRMENLGTRQNRWDWVPELVESPYVHVSHTICPICLAFYHSQEL